ncbi:MAG: hypothetical protein K8T89_09355 [Planctomycetes bacterium]|nr:hypothetical protein [Planctomycetota bacterium]
MAGTIASDFLAILHFSEGITEGIKASQPKKGIGTFWIEKKTKKKQRCQGASAKAGAKKGTDTFNIDDGTNKTCLSPFSLRNDRMTFRVFNYSRD